jgi:predicted TIM-barrel fold metal-dependent hydrolase
MRPAVIDADGHVEEELEAIVEAVPTGLRDAARDIIPLDPDGERSRRIEGRLWRPKYPYPGGGQNHLIAGGVRQEGGRDPRRRLEVLDAEGIDVAVLYPSSGQLFGLFENPETAAALCVAYNDWLAEYCSVAPSRLVGVALLPQQDPAAAAAELQRAVTDHHFVGGVLRPNRIGGRTIDDAAFEQLWATAAELDVPLVYHEAYVAGIDTVGIDRMSCYAGCHIVSHVFEQMSAMVVLTLAGAQDRFPGLRIGLFEAGCGWAPSWAQRIEEHFEYAPSDYRGGDPRGKLNRRMWLTFEIQEPLVGAVCASGWSENVCFASDYPHFDAVFPGAVSAVRQRALQPDVERQLLADNALRFYGPRFAQLVDGASP